ncbi:MAG: hypothetical protein QXZ27_08860 [Candidatus Bathyarchaeia archaeon]
MTLFKIYLFPSPCLSGLSLASRKIILDVARFSSELSFRQVFLGDRRNISSILRYYFKLIREWFGADVVLAIYPYLCVNIRRRHFLKVLESILINKLSKRTYSILYIVDLPIDREVILGSLKGEEYKRCCEVERRIFEGFSAILVFNENMKKIIQERYGFDDSKFILFEMLDYWAKDPPQEDFQFRFPLEIAFLTSSFDQERCSWIKELPRCKKVLNYHFYGMSGDWIRRLNRADFKYMGFISPDEAPKVICNHHFGMINYDPLIERYLQYGSTSKFSAYLSAGLPIICSSRFTYLSDLVQKYSVGVLFRSLDEIPEILLKLNRETYGKMRKNSIELGEKVRHGYFLKKAIITALQKQSSYPKQSF